MRYRQARRNRSAGRPLVVGKTRRPVAAKTHDWRQAGGRCSQARSVPTTCRSKSNALGKVARRQEGAPTRPADRGDKSDQQPC